MKCLREFRQLQDIEQIRTIFNAIDRYYVSLNTRKHGLTFIYIEMMIDSYMKEASEAVKDIMQTFYNDMKGSEA